MRDEVHIFLEMTAPGALVPSRNRPLSTVEMERVDVAAAALIRSMYVRIWEPFKSGGRTRWTDSDWAREISRSAIETWVARIDGDDAGFVELGTDPDDSVGIVVFGLLPEFQGRGFGAEFLTLATRRAWDMLGDRVPRRVWLMTSSTDHPNAITNYEARGFRRFREEPVAER